MSSNPYTSQKKELKFSKNKIKNAGRDIRKGNVTDEAIGVIHNFREFHLYPLMLLKNHLARESKKISKGIVIARRLKRLPTILNKLSRDTLDGTTKNQICLSRMHDIAGCRAIVPNKQALFSLRELLFKSGCVHKITKENNYLETKESGYGGIHLIYSCYSGSSKESPWKGAKVEVQLRTKLQHTWATALEIIDTFENSNLKTSYHGQDDYRRFFKLLGLLIAQKEGFIQLSYKDLNDIRYECIELNESCQIINNLKKYSLAIKASTNSKVLNSFRKKQGYFLVVFKFEDSQKHKLTATLTFFSLSDSELAISRYNETEVDEEVDMSALISVEDSKSLKKAYPNYFGAGFEIQSFMKEVINEWQLDSDIKLNLMTELIAIKENIADLSEKLDGVDIATLEHHDLNHRVRELREQEEVLETQLEPMI